MRIRRIGAAALVAAGLSVTLTGAASAGEPDPEGEIRIVTCEDGELVVREPNDEERERVKRFRVAPPDGGERRVHVRPGPDARDLPPIPEGGKGVLILRGDAHVPDDLRCGDRG